MYICLFLFVCGSDDGFDCGLFYLAFFCLQIKSLKSDPMLAIEPVLYVASGHCYM